MVIVKKNEKATYYDSRKTNIIHIPALFMYSLSIRNVYTMI